MNQCDCGDLHPGNSTTVELLSVKVNDVLNNDAVVTVTVKDSNGSVVSGGNAVAMPSIGGGGYRGVLPSTLAIVANARYTVEITATISGVGIGFWQIDKVAKKRSG